MLTLREFLNDNSHRSYPFTEDTKLPNNILLDGHFLVTGNVPKNGLFIDKVVITDSFIELHAAVEMDGVYTSLGVLLIADLRANYTHTVSLVNNKYKVLIDGSVTIGEIDSRQIGVYTLKETGRIFEGCVTPVTNWCTGLVINGKIYTGLVDLNFDTSFDVFEATDDTGRTTITITLPNYQVTAPEIDVDSMLDHFSTAPPVKSINGISPDSSGNITIESRDPDITAVESLISVEGVDIKWPTTNRISISGEQNTIIIKEVIPELPYDPNIKLGEQDVQTRALLDNCESLDERLQAVEKVLTVLENAQNTLNTQLTRG